MASQICDYHQVVTDLRKTFASDKTKSLEFRLKQLNGFLRLVDEHKDELLDALYEDLRKPKVEGAIMEFTVLRGEIISAINNLPSWMEFQPVKTDLINMANKCGFYYDPYGIVLVIGAWNYPLALSCQPMVGALAAGNCVILKPSEVSPATASLLTRLIPMYIDQECYKVINGGAAETTALLKERFDYIFYTGGTAVGRIVMKAAAEHLTPVTLELGGKSPCYVHRDCDFAIAANRIAWGKFVNVGQTCLAPDYILCHKDDQNKLVECIKETINNFYGKDLKSCPDLGRIINARHYKRIMSLIVKDKVVFGGETDESTNYIAPTIMTNVTEDDDVMKEEIFGPLLPIVPVDDVHDCIRFIKDREKPLALYLFAKDRAIAEQILKSTSSGSACINDTLVQAGVPTLPFGGVGQSGMGAYHQKFTFETFSHRKSCLFKKQQLESVEGIRYPPFANTPLRFINWAMTPSRRFALFAYAPYILLVVLMGVVYKVLNIKVTFN